MANATDGFVVSVEDVRDHLTLPRTSNENLNDSLDRRFSRLIQRVEGLFQGYTGKRLEIVETREEFVGGGQYFLLRNAPVSTKAEHPITITDTLTNTTVENTILDARQGKIFYENRRTWPRGQAGTFRYGVVYFGGLPASPDWETVTLPELHGSFLDFITDLYYNPNPRAIQTSEGGGVSAQYGQQFIPPRVALTWDGYKPIFL